MCNRGAKHLSAGVAQFNMVGFVKLFRTSVARQVSRKVEPLSTSAMVATIAEVVKNKSLHFLKMVSLALVTLHST